MHWFIVEWKWRLWGVFQSLLGNYPTCFIVGKDGELKDNKFHD